MLLPSEIHNIKTRTNELPSSHGPRTVRLPQGLRRTIGHGLIGLGTMVAGERRPRPAVAGNGR